MDSIICGFCQRQAQDPIGLLCSHYLCLHCAEFLQVVDSQRYSLSCPNCRQITMTYSINNLLIYPWNSEYLNSIKLMSNSDTNTQSLETQNNDIQAPNNEDLTMNMLQVKLKENNQDELMHSHHNNSQFEHQKSKDKIDFINNIHQNGQLFTPQQQSTDNSNSQLNINNFGASLHFSQQIHSVSCTNTPKKPYTDSVSLLQICNNQRFNKMGLNNSNNQSERSGSYSNQGFASDLANNNNNQENICNQFSNSHNKNFYPQTPKNDQQSSCSFSSSQYISNSNNKPSKFNTVTQGSMGNAMSNSQSKLIDQSQAIQMYQSKKDPQKTNLNGEKQSAHPNGDFHRETNQNCEVAPYLNNNFKKPLDFKSNNGVGVYLGNYINSTREHESNDQNISSAGGGKQRYHSKSVLETDGNSSTVSESPSLQCPIHQEPLTLYCNNDQSIVCVECIYSCQTHQNHVVIPLKSATKLIKKQNEVYQQETAQQFSSIQNAINTCSSNRIFLEASYLNINSIIQKEFQEIYEMVKQQQSDLVAEIQEFYKGQIGEYAQKINELGNLQTVLKEFTDVDKILGNDQYNEVQQEVCIFNSFNCFQETIDCLQLDFKQLNFDQMITIQCAQKSTLKNILDKVVSIDFSKCDSVINQSFNNNKRQGNPNTKHVKHQSSNIVLSYPQSYNSSNNFNAINNYSNHTQSNTINSSRLSPIHTNKPGILNNINGNQYMTVSQKSSQSNVNENFLNCNTQNSSRNNQQELKEIQYLKNLIIENEEKDRKPLSEKQKDNLQFKM